MAGFSPVDQRSDQLTVFVIVEPIWLCLSLAAYASALQNARKSGADKAAQEASRRGASFLGKARMSKDEALMVLNMSEKEATAEMIQKQYALYFEANKVEKGGSFYVQSKIYRAKELLDDYLKEKQRAENKER